MLDFGDKVNVTVNITNSFNNIGEREMTNQAESDILSQAIEILTELVAVAEATNNGDHSGEIDLSEAIAFINRISGGYEE